MSPARVLVTRDPAAAGELAALLRGRGYEPCAAPLLEAQLPEDPSEVRALLREAARPTVPTWLCVTSATTLAALDAVAQEHDWAAALERARTGGRLRVAAVGAATARALREYGVGVDHVPGGSQSAAGMLAQWPGEERTWLGAAAGPGSPGTASAGVPDAAAAEDGAVDDDAARPAPVPAPRALLPVSALASDTLAEGLAARGYDVHRVTAYEMVPVPAARPVRRRRGGGGRAAEDTGAAGRASVAAEMAELDPERARRACARGDVAAVVATAPSRVAALLDGTTVRSDVAWIAIGEPTARALRRHGVAPVTAAGPTPEALADAVDAALRGT